MLRGGVVNCRTWLPRILFAALPSAGPACALLMISLSASAQSKDEGAPPAESAPTGDADDPTVERAREAFVLGTGLAREGQWVDALSAFERSARLKPHPVTTYNLAYCERALGHYTRARQLFKVALDEHDAKKGGVLGKDLHAQAKSYLVEIERRLARVTLTVNPAGTTLAVDGRPIEAPDPSSGQSAYVAGTRDAGKPEPAPSGSFTLLVDPGRHIFVLARPGAPDTVATETFEPAEARTLDLVAREGERASGKPRARSAPPGPDYTWAILAYGVGAAGLAVGTIFGLSTLDTESELADNCKPTKLQCPRSFEGEIDHANRSALASSIGFGVGVAGVALGTFLLLSTGEPEGLNRPQKAARAPSIRGFIGLASAGVSGAF